MSGNESMGFPTPEQIKGVGLAVENLKVVAKNFKQFRAYLRKVGFSTKQAKRITPYVFDPKSAVRKLEKKQVLIAVIIKFPNSWPFVDVPVQDKKIDQLRKYGQVLSSWSCAEIEKTQDVFITYLMVIERNNILRISDKIENCYAVVILYPNPRLNMDRYETAIRLLPVKHPDWKFMGVL